MTAAAKNTLYMELMRERCEYVAGQSQDKKNIGGEKRGQDSKADCTVNVVLYS